MGEEAVLVTGVAGFIGMHVARRLLARGERVIGIDNLNDYYSTRLKEDRLAELESEADGRFTMLRLDFADHGALEAALDNRDSTGSSISARRRACAIRSKIRMPMSSPTSSGMSICSRSRDIAGVDHLVYASSSSVYGGGTTLPFSVDNRADHPLSLYAATKRADELMSETYAHLYRLPQTGLRFFTVYGPWGRPDMAMWLFTDAILAGPPDPGVQRRRYAARLHLYRRYRRRRAGLPRQSARRMTARPRRAAADGPHRLYNIGNHRSEAADRLVDLIEQACGRQAERIDMPMQPGDVKDTFADIEAISRDIGFAPTISIDVGVPRFVDWFRAYHAL